MATNGTSCLSLYLMSSSAINKEAAGNTFCACMGTNNSVSARSFVSENTHKRDQQNTSRNQIPFLGKEIRPLILPSLTVI